MNRVTIAELLALFDKQGGAGINDRLDLAFVCPMCGAVQSMRSLIAAGCDKEAAESKVHFSCIGRLTNAGPPRKEKDGKGCNWTLGGLFQLHTLEVIDGEGKAHPSFEVATPEQAIELYRKRGEPK